MASTYSPALRLELMATGDQSGTWGDTTNTNIGTLLEQAITGVLSVAEGDTTLTLTSNNGATDQARNAVVILTGAMTGAHNVVVPTSNKLYLVKNSTTGGFATTVKTAAGTGVAIAAGTSQWVYCDGTNVVAGLLGNGIPDSNNNLTVNNLLEGYTTTATAAGTTTLTVASTYLQFFTGATTHTVVMPVASTLVLGQAWRIVNNSSGAVTVNSSGANAIVVLAAGTWATIECILTSGTSAASWSAQYSGLAVTTAKKLSVSNSLTLAGTDGKTLTVSNSLTLAGTDSTTMTFPATSSTVVTTGNTATLASGYTNTSFNIGTVSSGTTAPAAANNNLQFLTNNGAFTLAAPAADSAINILVTNGASAGAITFSGFTVGSNTGDTYATTNANKYVLQLLRINGTSTYAWKALQ